MDWEIINDQYLIIDATSSLIVCLYILCIDGLGMQNIETVVTKCKVTHNHLDDSKRNELKLG